MDHRHAQPRRRRDQRLLDLDDAPALDASEEAALDAIRRQLDAEFSGAEAVREAPDVAANRPVTRVEPSTPEYPGAHLAPPPAPEVRPAPEGMRTPVVPDREPRPRPASSADARSRLESRERQRPPWSRPERLREERMGLLPPRPAREPLERVFARRIPPQWREASAPPSPPEERRSRGGLLLTIGLVAGLAGGVAGALLTGLLMMGGRVDPLQESWNTLVTVAHDSGLAGVVAAVTGRSGDARQRDAAASGARSPQATAARPPSSAPRRGPVTTSEIPDPAKSAGRRPESGGTDLRDLVAAGRDAYVRNDYETAELLFAEAVQRSATDGLLRYHHAIALMGLGRFSEARSEFRNALGLGVPPTVADEAQRALTQLNTNRRRR